MNKMANLNQNDEFKSKWQIQIKMANLTQNGEFKSKWRILNKMAHKEYVPGAVEVWSKLCAGKESHILVLSLTTRITITEQNFQNKN